MEGLKSKGHRRWPRALGLTLGVIYVLDRIFRQKVKIENRDICLFYQKGRLITLRLSSLISPERRSLFESAFHPEKLGSYPKISRYGSLLPGKFLSEP